MSEHRLTTTSYAILGLLAIGEWSTYELAAQMRRSLQHIWPRAASGIYEEPKRLVKAGLANADRSSTGRRPRTVYRITPAGRAALRSWVEEGAGAGRSYESEPMVRFLLGNVASKDALLRAIEDVALAAKAALAAWVEVAAPYASGQGRYPERLHVNAVTMRLAFDIAMTELGWAEWARAEVEGWPDARSAGDQAGGLQRMLGDLVARAPRSEA